MHIFKKISEKMQYKDFVGVKMFRDWKIYKVLQDKTRLFVITY